MELDANTSRRACLRLAAASAAAASVRAFGTGTGARPRVVIVGGGYGGATAARQLKRIGSESVDVTLVERDAAFVSCPLSNLVVGGSRTIGDVTVPYDRLARHGVRVVRDVAVAVDVDRREVRLARGAPLRYERLILSPGIDFFFQRIEGLDSDAARARFLHAWKAGPQTVALRRQLEAMRDGGVFAISIPRAPLRCPPAPYERACQVAWYLKRAKPRSKVLVLDGNEEVQAEKALFERAWAETYRGLVEYRPDYVLTGVDAATSTARFEVADDERADVLNVIPPHGAGAIARSARVITANDRWCEVDFRTFESIRVPRVHVLGDAIQVAPAMPKSGQMANQHGRVAAAAIVDALLERPPRDPADLEGSCYSYVSDVEAGHIASRHRYEAVQKTYLPVEGAGSVATEATRADGDAGRAWARRIWADMLG